MNENVTEESVNDTSLNLVIGSEIQPAGATSLVITPTLETFQRLLQQAQSQLLIASAWITQNFMNWDRVAPDVKISVLLQGNMQDFLLGLSSLDAVEALLQSGAQVRLAQNLHAKIYIRDEDEALITSANLTHNGMSANLEAGVLTEDRLLIENLTETYMYWWSKAAPINEAWVDQVRTVLEYTDTSGFEALQKRLREHRHLEGASIRAVPDTDFVPYNERYRTLPMPEVWQPVLEALKEGNLPELGAVLPRVEDVCNWARTIINPRNYEILFRRLGHGDTLDAIGQDLGVTRERVRQICKKSLGKLQTSVPRQSDIAQLVSAVREGRAVRVVVPSPDTEPRYRFAFELMAEIDELELEIRTAKLPAPGLLVVPSQLLVVRDRLEVYMRDHPEYMAVSMIANELDVDSTTIEAASELSERVYFTRDGRLADRTWSQFTRAELLAWELALNLEVLSFHGSQLGTALALLHPDMEHYRASARYTLSLLSRKDQTTFQYAGKRGHHGLRALHDGISSNKEAITKTLSEQPGGAMTITDLHDRLTARGRAISFSTLYALLKREKIFSERVGLWTYTG